MVHEKAWFVALTCAIGLSIAGTFSPAIAEGEPDGSFPSWEERWVHELINRARCDPQVELAACDDCADRFCYTPTAPVAWSSALNRAARFHSAEMTLQGFLSHDSVCTLVSNIASIYPEPCDGSAHCACVGGVSACSPECTTAWERVALFGAVYRGEVVAPGSDPQIPFYLWLLEPSNNPACQFTFDHGHRWTLLTTTGAVGVGRHDFYWTAVFGSGPNPDKVASGSHYPRQAETVELWANWYDSTGATAAAANVDGICLPLRLERGTLDNGAWRAEATGVGEGCHRYYFEFRDGIGATFEYPSTGSLGIGSKEACPDWDTGRHAACLVFGDNFENGSTALWSRTVP